MLTYSQGRNLIQSGDILAFHTTPFLGWGPKIVSFFTGYTVYHVGVAVWMYSSEGEQRLFIVEANKGNRQIVPLSLYAGERIDVYKCPVPFSAISWNLLEPIGSIKYSWLDLISIFFKEKLHIPMKNHKGEVCSEMIQRILSKAGFEITTPQISPGKLISELIHKNVKLRVSLDK